VPLAVDSDVVNVALDALPPPSRDATALSERLVAMVCAEIDAHGGWLPFDRYMELALYAPGVGYYSAGSVKLGPAGDFVTAPELSDVFGRVLAAEIRRRLETLERPMILELGAGSGRLAATILEVLDVAGGVRPEYCILEPSADLRQRQQLTLAAEGYRVEWLDRLPATPFDGVVLANEVIDALPVAVFEKRGDAVVPLGVSVVEGALVWADGPSDAALAAAVTALENTLGAPLPDGFRSEIRPSLPAWIAGIAQPLRRGSVLLIDYGMSRSDYYRPERSGGTLICHYRHRAHDDPFFQPGLQDLSAWVDFSACADAAAAAGLTIDGYTTQAQFLLHGGAMEALEGLDERDRLAQANALKRLLLPGEMGERFKLLALCRGRRAGLPGRDFRDRL
jgi:SAM-dependent MidA family methyltransferase